MRLDRDLPYEEVIGVAGVKFMQGPNYFAADGHPMLIEQGHARRVRPDEMPAAPVVSAPAAEAEADYDSMTTNELKAALVVYGGKWVNREDAVAFLRENG